MPSANIDSNDLKMIVIGAMCWYSHQAGETEKLAKQLEDFLECGGMPEMLAAVSRVGVAMVNAIGDECEGS